MGEEMSSLVDRQKPKPYHHGDLRHALIQAGLEMLAEGGAAALDLRKVARKAGVSHAAPYRHFADKQPLVPAINEEGFRPPHWTIPLTLPKPPSQPFHPLLTLPS